MTILAATTAGESKSNVWMTALYAGLATAIIAIITCLTFEWEMPFLYIPAYLLIGIGPVLGYQFTAGNLGDWKSLLGGFLGQIIPVFGWPILVGLFSKEQSVGKLILASLLGSVIAISVFFIMQTVLGLNPYIIGTSFIVGAACWGGTVGAAMDGWKKADVA